MPKFYTNDQIIAHEVEKLYGTDSPEIKDVYSSLNLTINDFEFTGVFKPPQKGEYYLWWANKTVYRSTANNTRSKALILRLKNSS